MSEGLSEFSFSYHSSISLRAVFSHKGLDSSQGGLGETVSNIDEVLAETQLSPATADSTENSKTPRSGGTLALEGVIGSIDEVLRDNVSQGSSANEV